MECCHQIGGTETTWYGCSISIQRLRTSGRSEWKNNKDTREDSEQTAVPTVKTEAIQVGEEEKVDESELVDNPYILSHTQSVPPKSYVDNRQPYN